MNSLSLFDNTMIETYDTCPREFFERFIASIKPTGESPALTAGRAVHQFLKSWYDPLEDRDTFVTEMMKEVNVDILPSAHDYKGEWTNRERAAFLHLLTDVKELSSITSDHRCCAPQLIDIMFRYIEYWRTNDYQPFILAEGPIRPEVFAKIAIGDCLYGGKIDLDRKS